MKRKSVRRKVRGTSGRALRIVGLGAVVTASSCTSFDTTRQTGPSATLGDDIYGVFCDRLGASSFTEDLTGASYASICHYDANGNYGNTVDQSLLPPPATSAETAARQLSVAKLERMAQRRADVVHALNATFPDVMIRDITSPSPNAQVRLHTALMTFAQSITPLYQQNPIEPSAGPLLPTQTEAMGRLFNSIGGGATALSSLSHMWGRRGYRPFQVGLGAVRPALAYPNLRTLTTSALSLLAPGGAAASQLQQVLGVAKQELLTATPTVAPLPNYVVNTTTAQPNRPRSDMEFASAFFLSQDPAFTTGSTSLFIAQRDRRGIVIPVGNTPGVVGTVPSPFVDLNNDGFADIDSFGEFVGADGTPLTLDTPFAIPEITTSTPDAYGRPPVAATTFRYIDTSKTLLSALSQSLLPLLDPTMQTAPGDPNAWQSENETVMYALAGAYELFGTRLPATYNYGQEGPGGTTVSYKGFDPSASPLPDLVHASGQVLADQDSDAILLSLLDLLQNHESTVARLMGAVLQLRAVAAQHDQLAASGSEPLASLAYNVPIWDQMAQVVQLITQKPGLMTALLGAIANNVVVSPSADGSATDMGDAISKFCNFRDQLQYNKNGTHYDGSPHDSSGGINGPAVNLTVDPNGNDQSDPKTPVDNTMPRTGTNTSCMQRSLRIIADANGGPACNRNGATVAAKIGGLSVTWPVTGFPVYASPYTECGLFEFTNLGVFYLDSLLPATHPKRSTLTIKANGLNDILSFLGDVGASEDTLLEESSDITGLTTHPANYALARLVWYGASTNNPNYANMPDFDAQNAGTQTDTFVSGTIDPISPAWCTPDASNMVPTCTDKSSTLRVRDIDSIFLFERFGFTDYLAPVVQALADTACGPNETNCNLNDTSGEQIFTAAVSVLNTFWPGPDHGSECSSTPGSPIYCPGAAVNNYEPILVDAFHTDLIAALNEFAAVASTLSTITVQRGPNAGQVWTGAQVLEKLTTILFDQKYAASVGMVDRQGNSSATWVDGTPQAQLTVFTLFADALHKIDTSFANACVGASDMAACTADAQMRQGMWKRARSQLTDEFLTVDNQGPSASFHNPMVTPTLISLLKLAREQVNANCPMRESGVPCTWAKSGLDTNLANTMSRPLFASLVDMTDQIRQNDTSRRQLETFLQYVLTRATSDGQDYQSMLASFADILQVLLDDGDLSPILQSAAPGASPDADPAGAGVADVGIQLLKALTNDTYDRYHVMDQVLPNVVTPIEGGTNLTPIEIFMDVIADVNRVDAADANGLAPVDYGTIMSTMKGFMLDKTRGMEQLYTIIQKRPNP